MCYSHGTVSELQHDDDLRFVASDTSTMSGLRGGLSNMLGILKLVAQIHWQLPVLCSDEKPGVSLDVRRKLMVLITGFDLR